MLREERISTYSFEFLSTILTLFLFALSAPLSFYKTRRENPPYRPKNPLCRTKPNLYRKKEERRSPFLTRFHETEIIYRLFYFNDFLFYQRNHRRNSLFYIRLVYIFSFNVFCLFTSEFRRYMTTIGIFLIPFDLSLRYNGYAVK